MTEKDKDRAELVERMVRVKSREVALQVAFQLLKNDTPDQLRAMYPYFSPEMWHFLRELFPSNGERQSETWVPQMHQKDFDRLLEPIRRRLELEDREAERRQRSEENNSM